MRLFGWTSRADVVLGNAVSDPLCRTDSIYLWVSILPGSGCMAFLPVLAEFCRDFGKPGQVQQLDSGALPEKAEAKWVETVGGTGWCPWIWSPMLVDVHHSDDNSVDAKETHTHTQRLERNGLHVLHFDFVMFCLMVLYLKSKISWTLPEQHTFGFV